MTYRRAAGGYAVVQSYRHLEADGSHFEGHGIFTLDPGHPDVFWYYVDSTGAPSDAPSRCTWHDGVLRAERRGSAGWTRHTISVADAVLLHVTELRTPERDRRGGEQDARANGKRPAFLPFMTSTFRRD